MKQKSLKINKKKTKLKLRLANNQDLLFVFNLYNKNVLEKKFFSSKQVSLFSHKSWFNSIIKKKMLYICSLQERLGYIRFDKINNKNLSISIAIVDKYKRRGFGRNMIIKALNKKKILKYNIWAKVKKTNNVSKKFFLNSGFKLVKNNHFLKKSKLNEKIYK